MNVINGKGIPLGRLASFAAKIALKGEEVSVVNCDEVIITGRFDFIRKEFEEKRGRVGSGLRGPKIHRTSERIVKRAIRGMLPNARRGRGKETLKKIKCYNGLPKELEKEKLTEIKTLKKARYSKVKEFTK